MIDQYNRNKGYPAQLMQCACVCVCVKTEPTRFEKSWQEQPDFLKKREDLWQIS